MLFVKLEIGKKLIGNSQPNQKPHAPSIIRANKAFNNSPASVELFHLLVLSYILHPSSASTFESVSDGSSPYMSASFRKRGPKLDK